jgi:hypothetical protein
VEALLGQGLAALRFEAGRVSFIRAEQEGGAIFDTTEVRPCEVLRSALKLPSCPRTASFDGEDLIFEGQGRGHGEGLDVEAMKASGLRSDEILERAYGAPGSRGNSTVKSAP